MAEDGFSLSELLLLLSFNLDGYDESLVWIARSFKGFLQVFLFLFLSLISGRNIQSPRGVKGSDNSWLVCQWVV